MLRLGHITQEEHDAAQAEPITLNVTEISGSGVDVYSQPYFVAYVKQLLEQEFSTDVLFKGGLTVKTTIDPTMQQVAENAVREQLDTLSLDGLDMGMVVVDPKTGYIKCMVGGYDYNADENHVNHATAKRPVGSTFKAFTLATAIQNGMNPNVTLNCNSPLKAKGTTTEVQNYANHSYGNITLKQATAYSSNTGYIQVAEAVGNSKIISLVKKPRHRSRQGQHRGRSRHDARHRLDLAARDGRRLRDVCQRAATIASRSPSPRLTLVPVRCCTSTPTIPHRCLPRARPPRSPMFCPASCRAAVRVLPVP